MSSVWVLTDEYTDYDQHGEYYLAAFKDKPTNEQLEKILGPCQYGVLDHLLTGGVECTENIIGTGYMRRNYVEHTSNP